MRPGGQGARASAAHKGTGGTPTHPPTNPPIHSPSTPQHGVWKPDARHDADVSGDALVFVVCVAFGLGVAVDDRDAVAAAHRVRYAHVDARALVVALHDGAAVAHGVAVGLRRRDGVAGVVSDGVAVAVEDGDAAADRRSVALAHGDAVDAGVTLEVADGEPLALAVADGDLVSDQVAHGERGCAPRLGRGVRAS